jgi:phenylpyruvate tautomerase PptA (4-oxalocrotonate tautomerase family)
VGNADHVVDKTGAPVPTYVVRARAETLIPGRRQRLAEQIAEAHHRVTGDDRSFVQVVVEDLRGRDHFIGGRVAASGSVFVHGHVRAGRDEQTLAALAAGVRDAVVATSDVVEDLVWVYLVELPPERMLEATIPTVP